MYDHIDPDEHIEISGHPHAVVQAQNPILILATISRYKVSFGDKQRGYQRSIAIKSGSLLIPFITSIKGNLLRKPTT